MLGRYGGPDAGSAWATATSAPTCTAPNGSPRRRRLLSDVTAEIAAALGPRPDAAAGHRRPPAAPMVTVDDGTRAPARDRLPGVLRPAPPRRPGAPRCASTAPTRPTRRPACSMPSPPPTPSSSPPRTRSCPSGRSWPSPASARRSLRASRPDVVAVSPIVAGAALKGPADRLLDRARPRGQRRRRGPPVRRLRRHPRHRRGRRRPGRRRRGRGHALRRHRHGHATPSGRRAGPQCSPPSRTPACRPLPRPRSGTGSSVRTHVVAPERSRVRPAARRASVIPIRGIREIAAGADLAGDHRRRRRRRPRRPPSSTATSSSSPRRSSPRPRDRIVAIDPDDPAPTSRSSSGSRCGSCAGGATSSSARPRTASCAPTPASTCRTSRPGYAALLPVDSDRSARRIRDGLRHRTGVDVAVIVSDTFGRPWRRGVTDVAIGCAGIAADRRPPRHRRRARTRAAGHRGRRRRRARRAPPTW